MNNNEGHIDEIIRTRASEYNRPPATPSDEMWTAIQAAREIAATGPQLHVVAGGAAKAAPIIGHSTSHRSSPRYAWLGLAAAAVLLVATGVGIGRWTNANPATAERRVADAPSSSVPPVTGDGIVAPDERRARSREEIRRNLIVRGRGSLNRVASDTRSTPPNNTGGVEMVSYQVATQQHLQDAETLLTSFSLESRDERMNTQFAGWAKGLLSNTRLLLDSPAGDDPRRAKLLQDLELVLAQIVQLSPDAPASDRELVQGSIQNGMVMTRLRSAIPADQPREITERQ